MKNSLLLVVLIVLMGMASCGPGKDMTNPNSTKEIRNQEERSEIVSISNTYTDEDAPEQAVKNFLNAIKNGDGETAELYVDWSRFRHLFDNEEEFNKEIQEAIDYDLNRNEGIAKYQIENVTSADDGAYNVFTKITFNNGEEESLRYTVANINGKWLIIN
jgi:hypothetical protein